MTAADSRRRVADDVALDAAMMPATLRVAEPRGALGDGVEDAAEGRWATRR